MDFKFTELGKLGKSISVQEMKGNDTIYFRLTKLYKDDEGNWHPTKQGVSIPLSECNTLLKVLNIFIQAHSDDLGINDSPNDLTGDIKALEQS
jgi:hypothetical protein